MECPICYESFAEGDPLQPKQLTKDSTELAGLSAGNATHRERRRLPDCNHEFCRPCLVEHVRLSTQSRDLPIPCPQWDCEESLATEFVEGLLVRNKNEPSSYGSVGMDHESHADLWSRYQRYDRMRMDPSLVACTRCNELSSVTTLDVETGDANFQCPSCRHTFCTIHGDAHLGKTCREFEVRQRTSEHRRSERAIRRSSKPCSHCSVPIFKEAGCDHIICTSCKKDFCFNCGTHIHLTGTMIRACGKCNRSYVDHRHIWAYRCLQILTIPLFVPYCIFHIILVGAFAIATCGCCFCLGCGVQADANDSTILSFRPMKATRVVLAIVLLPLLDMLSQCGVTSVCCLGALQEELSEAPKRSDTEDDLDSDNGSLSGIDEPDVELGGASGSTNHRGD